MRQNADHIDDGRRTGDRTTPGADRDRRVAPRRMAAATVLAAGAFVAASGLSPDAATAKEMSERRMFPPNNILDRNKEGRPFVYGQINKGILVHDDGKDTKTYPLVDNDNSGTRIGMTYEDTGGVGVNTYANVEVQWFPYASDRVNQLNKDNVDWHKNDVRHLEARFEFVGYGRIWAGQGAMASDSSAERDLSGTGVIAYSSIQDTAGGQLFAFKGAPGLSGVSVGDAFSNLDGLGRRMRVRYDTPEWNGFMLSASAGYSEFAGSGIDDTGWDVAARYSRDEDGEDFAFDAGLAFARNEDDNNRISGSFSMLHQPTGLSLTLAGGYEDRDDTSQDPRYVYAKLGYAPDLTSVGPTAFSVDVTVGDDYNVNGSDSFSIGVAAVQTIALADVAFDLYTVLRHHDYDDSAGSYKNGLSSLSGLRWRF